MTARIVSYDERVFRDREEAGSALAQQLSELRGNKTLVLGIPRGGVVIAEAIARALDAELDILLSRKLGAPETPELAIGAVTEDGTVFLNSTMIDELNIPKEYIKEETKRQQEEIRRRVTRFRSIRPKAAMTGRPVIITDDGAATGATLEAALWSCRQENPSRLVCAFPVGSDQAAVRLAHDSDLLVALSVPPLFAAVSQAYAQFPQVSDEQVMEILQDEERRSAGTDRKGAGNLR